MKMNKIKKYALPILSLLLFSSCSPQPQVEKKEKIVQKSQCKLDKTVAPEWACQTLNNSFIRVNGLKNNKSTLFNEFEKEYLLDSQKILKTKKISKDDREKIIEDSRVNLAEIVKEWEDTNATSHLIYALSEDELEKRVTHSIEKYKHTRVYTNCFRTGKVSVSKSCKRDIKNFLKEIPLKDKKNIIIEVHTDKVGSAKKNLNISKKRALNVALSIQTQEQKKSKIFYAGYGESQLLYDSQTKEANFQNRRVVVSVKDKNYKSNSKKLASYKTKGVVPFKPHLKKTKKVALKKEIQKVAVVVPVVPVVVPKKSVNLQRYTGKSIVGHTHKFSIACIDDTPIDMKRQEFSNAKERAFLSDFYKKRISGNYKDKYVEIYPVNIFKNGALTNEDPTITVYSDRADTKRYKTEVNSYRGSAGVLYRVFVKGDRDIKCMDFVFSYSHGDQKYGRVYLEEDKKVKALKFISE